MLSDEQLLLSLRRLATQGQRGPALLLLSQVKQPASTAKIREHGELVGFRDIKKWNVAHILRAAANDHQVAQLSDGWRILGPGLKLIEAHYRPEAAVIRETRHALRGHLDKISDNQRRMFVEEAIRSFDVKAYRAAVVLSWVGAVHIIQEHIISQHLSAFNAAGSVRAARAAASGGRYAFSPVRGIKDFGVIGEADLLQLCQDAGIFHKAEKQILGERLDLRNQCGHPNPIVIAEHVVASHIEILMLNVYSKY